MIDNNNSSSKWAANADGIENGKEEPRTSNRRKIINYNSTGSGHVACGLGGDDRRSYAILRTVNVYLSGKKEAKDEQCECI